MKILILAHLQPAPADNGAKLRILHLARELVREHQVAVLAPAAPDALQSELGPQALVAAFAWPLSHGERAARRHLAPFPRDEQPFVAATARQLDERVRAWRPDVIFATDPALGEYLRPYAGALRVVDIAAEHVLYLMPGTHAGV
ncbi:MAG: glycosyltransferase family 1 protein [Chloroflexales bacterium]|nr:glycosyltransferase family 1 protein [Chloroflexales bacterium]